jgi:hypothetical protein
MRIMMSHLLSILVEEVDVAGPEAEVVAVVVRRGIAASCFLRLTQSKLLRDRNGKQRIATTWQSRNHLLRLGPWL